MDSIIAMSTKTKPALHRTGLSIKRRELVAQVMAIEFEGWHVVASIIKANLQTKHRTTLEWQTLPVPIIMEFIVLMKFGWHNVKHVNSGVMLLMLAPLAFMMQPFLLESNIDFLVLIHSITIVHHLLLLLLMMPVDLQL